MHIAVHKLRLNKDHIDFKICPARGQQKMVFKWACFLVLFSFTMSTADGSVKRLKWQNCDATAPVLIQSITVLPYPISLKEGAKLRVTGVLNLNFQVSLKIQRKLLWWETLPCVSSIGSCNYHIGETKIPTQTITVPDIHVPTFLIDGTYKVRADIRQEGTGNRLFCVSAEFQIGT